MNKVKVKREEMLAKVNANLATHRADFLKAQEGFKAAVIAELERKLSDARDGKPVTRGLELAEPEDHTDDYNRVIGMLQMSVEDTIELSSQEFDQYIMDNWSWSGFVKATYANYIKT